MRSFPPDNIFGENELIVMEDDECGWDGPGPHFYKFAQIRFGGPQVPQRPIGMFKNLYIDSVGPIDAPSRVQDAWWTVVRSIFDGAPLPDALTVLSLFERNPACREQGMVASDTFQALVWNGFAYGLIEAETVSLWPVPHFHVKVWREVSADWVQNIFLPTLLGEATNPDANFTALQLTWQLACDSHQGPDGLFHRGIPSQTFDSWTFAQGTEWEDWHEEERDDVIHGVADYVGDECLAYIDRLYIEGKNRRPEVVKCPFSDGVDLHSG
jgi:hypothetical protein